MQIHTHKYDKFKKSALGCFLSFFVAYKFTLHLYANHCKTNKCGGALLLHLFNFLYCFNLFFPLFCFECLTQRKRDVEKTAKHSKMKKVKQIAIDFFSYLSQIVFEFANKYFFSVFLSRYYFFESFSKCLCIIIQSKLTNKISAIAKTTYNVKCFERKIPV